MNTPAIPYAAVMPYLTVSDAAKAIAFYKEAFGATERFRLADAESGRVGHAELVLNGSIIMLSDEHPAYGNKSPLALGGSAVTFCVMVENTDVSFAGAIAAGATVIMPPGDQFYGFRSASVRDPFGHQWMLQHEIEKVSPEEMQARWDAMVKSCKPQ